MTVTGILALLAIGYLAGRLAALIEGPKAPIRRAMGTVLVVAEERSHWSSTLARVKA